MANLSLTVTDLIQAKPDEEAVISILTKVVIMMIIVMIWIRIMMINDHCDDYDLDHDDLDGDADEEAVISILTRWGSS